MGRERFNRPYGTDAKSKYPILPSDKSLGYCQPTLRVETLACQSTPRVEMPANSERGWTQNTAFDVPPTRRKRRAYYRPGGKGRERPSSPLPLPPSAFRLSPSPFRLPPSAFTLIEMLIVVSIMMILVAAAASVMRPAGDSRRIREAARAINVYLSSARNHAMETGRPCGVMFHTLPGANNAIVSMDQCEVPPCYCGSTEESVAEVIPNGPNKWTATLWTNSTKTVRDPIPPSMVKQTDLIQFNCQGPLFYIDIFASAADGTIDANTTYLLPSGSDLTTPSRVQIALYNAPADQIVPWAVGLPTVPYRIYRTAVKNAAQPLQLPASTVVDLDGSGTDDPQPLTAGITFMPDGSVGSCFGTGYTTRLIFLLVGKRERMLNGYTAGNTNEQMMTNYQDLNNVWVVINPQTGLINTEPLSALVGTETQAQAILKARELAREGQGMGGK
jgi:type II secretory pathway pseudopilin PulG